jgi:hypothetical protein
MPPTQQDHQDHRAADFDALDELGAAFSRCLAGPVSPHLREQIHDAARAVGLREVARRDVKRLTLAPPSPARPGPAPKLTPPRRPLLVALDGDAVDVPQVDADEAWWDDALRVASRHGDVELRPSAALVRDALRRAALAWLS